MITKIVERYKEQGTWNPTPVISEEGFEHLQTVMESSGELVKRVAFDALMDNSIALEALGMQE